MRMTRLLLLIASVISVASTYAIAQKAAPSQPWQGSWQKFVEAHNACIKVKTCDRKRFLNKEVRWEGVVSSIDLTKETPTVVMEMSGPPLADQTGEALNPGDLFVFVLNPLKSEVAGWTTVVKGERVRFSARTAGGLTGSVISFSSLPGRNLKMIMVNLDGGKFTAKVPEVAKSVSTVTKAPAKSTPATITSAPAKMTAKTVPELTAEGYRDLIVKHADSVSLMQNGVIKSMQALQSTPVCVVTLDPEKQKLAAANTAVHRKAWADARVPKELIESHKAILSWIESAESQFQSAPECMYGGSLPLLFFFGTFGSYDEKRANAGTALSALGVTLPPIDKPNAEKKPASTPAVAPGQPTATIPDKPRAEESTKVEPTTTPEAWQTDWDTFLKDYQACLNDPTCQPDTKFGKGKSLEWSGILRGRYPHLLFGTWFLVEMSPATIVDRQGQSIPIGNNLLVSPAATATWDAVPVGRSIRFSGEMRAPPKALNHCWGPRKGKCIDVELVHTVTLVAAPTKTGESEATVGGPGGESRPAQPTADANPELTAEAYRDLILNTTDPLAKVGAFGSTTEGTGSRWANGRQIPCIMIYSYTEADARNVAEALKKWASVRVPKALSVSHAEILKWIKDTDLAAKRMPKCFLPLLQSSVEQHDFLMILGDYKDELRKKAATELAALGVTLPELPKSANK